MYIYKQQTVHNSQFTSKAEAQSKHNIKKYKIRNSFPLNKF